MLLVTGASGFIGRRLCAKSAEKGCATRAAVRKQLSPEILAGVEQVIIGDISPDTQWHESLKGVSCVIHLAARVHIMNDDADDPLDEFRKINVNATLKLAQQAADAGVKRFIYLSSIKVNGEQTDDKQVYTADDTPNPVDPYAISKYEAEQGLQSIAATTGMDIVIIRPPLVYGPGVMANFRKMMKWLVKRAPLPLAAIQNKRSLVALDNLVDFILTCINHPAAANQIFLVGDGEDLSTTDLLRRLGNALGKPAMLFPVPVVLLKLGAVLVGKPDIAQRLCESLQIDISKAQKLLRWTPPFSVDKSLVQVAEDFLESQR